MTKTKSDIIRELDRNLSADSTASTLTKDLTRITYAPQLGYRSWIFKYKGVLVELFDMGNGHYAYERPAHKIDIIFARIYCAIEKRITK